MAGSDRSGTAQIGQRVTRLEDQRLLRGQGRFVDDVDLVGQSWARVVRSQVAHGRLRSVDVSDAARVPGVRGVLTAADLVGSPRIPIRMAVTHDDLERALQPVLAVNRVRYVGEPVALIVADDPYVAEDAAERVRIEIDELAVQLDPRAAMLAGAVELHPDGPNVVATLEVGFGDIEAAFAGDVRVIEHRVKIGRHSGVPLETRGLIARWDAGMRRLEVWGATKVAHHNRSVLAQLLGIPSSRIDLYTVDVGGGFGPRGEFYPEDFLIPFAARYFGRPIKWVEDRVENLVAMNHSRDQEHRYRASFSADGRLLGLRADIIHDNGAYVRTHGVTVPNLTVGMLLGPYRTDAYAATLQVVMTNKTPCGTYRAPGRFEVTAAREQLLDVAAVELGIDPLELRRRNLLSRSELPHARPFSTLGTETVLDDADYQGLLDMSLEAAGFSRWQAESAAARSDGRLVGCGLALFLEKSGLGPSERGRVEIDLDGQLRVLTGGASLGQGIETTLAQIAAEALAMDASLVTVIHGDTRSVPHGGGSYASRTTVMSGSAIHLAALAVRQKAICVAARLLRVSEDRIDVTPMGFVVTGKGAGSKGHASWADVARAYARDADRDTDLENDGEIELAATRTFTSHHMTYPYGVHLAQVEVDPGTGGVTILRYLVGYEIGRAVNPMLVEGQIVGGAAQGIGGALLEDFAYDESGQPLATSFIDYLMPTASEVPQVATLITELVPSESNPRGVKGGGEGGTTAAGAVLMSAIADAIGRVGILVELPLTPERVLQALRRTEV